MSDDLSAPTFDPNERSPLAPYQGAAPPAPTWFTTALAQMPERRFFQIDGVALELLTWGEVGKPGLLLLHGGRAHADWWSFIAPFFAGSYRVAALSWSGMGRSGWRESYAPDVLAREALGAIEAGGLNRGAEAPRLVAHSFGGWMAMYLAAHHGERFKAVVVLDSGVEPPSDPNSPPRHAPRPPRPNRVYATLEEALAHFRLAPAQTCDNPYILDYIARQALKPTPMTEVSGAVGWTWRFDPYLFAKIPKTFQAQVADALPAARCPIALIWGDRSVLLRGAFLDYTLAAAPTGTPKIVMPQAAHHLFLDQPLATVSSLRSLFAAWPSAAVGSTA